MRVIRALAVGILAAWALAACGGPKIGPGPLHVETSASSGQGPILVQHISYTTFDGSRVPALFSIPRAAPPRGCLIWENGGGSRKEQTEPLWAPAARLGVAVFAIDLRDHGQRATSKANFPLALHSPVLIQSLVTGTVKDLERAVDYLWSLPECRHNIGYAGLSLGGMIGSVLAGQDPRIKMLVLMSVPPTFRALIATDPTVLFPGIEHRPTQLEQAVRLLSPLDPDKWIPRISPRPLLLMIGRHDPLVPPAYAQQTERSARAPKTVVNYNGGHLPLAGAVAATNAATIAAFLLKEMVEPSYGPS